MKALGFSALLAVAVVAMPGFAAEPQPATTPGCKPATDGKTATNNVNRNTDGRGVMNVGQPGAANNARDPQKRGVMNTAQTGANAQANCTAAPDKPKP